MGTTIRPEISKKREYWLEKHRKYELIHFCRQYPIWRKAYYSLDGLSRNPYLYVRFADRANPTERCVMAKLELKEKMDLVEKAAELADEEFKDLILIGVTAGKSYSELAARYIFDYKKMTKNRYYELYHKFFYILHKLKKD